jgi:hypothetical protein
MAPFRTTTMMLGQTFTPEVDGQHRVVRLGDVVPVKVEVAKRWILNGIAEAVEPSPDVPVDSVQERPPAMAKAGQDARPFAEQLCDPARREFMRELFGGWLAIKDVSELKAYLADADYAELMELRGNLVSARTDDRELVGYVRVLIVHVDGELSGSASRAPLPGRPEYHASLAAAVRAQLHALRLLQPETASPAPHVDLEAATTLGAGPAPPHVTRLEELQTAMRNIWLRTGRIATQEQLIQELGHGDARALRRELDSHKQHDPRWDWNALKAGSISG